MKPRPTFQDRWHTHVFALLSGEAGSNHLAQDYWPIEDLWSLQEPVRFRWLKLFWVYSASVFVQMVLPALLSVAIVLLFKTDVHHAWWIVVLGIGLVAALAYGAIFSTTTCFDLWRHNRSVGHSGSEKSPPD